MLSAFCRGAQSSRETELTAKVTLLGERRGLGPGHMSAGLTSSLPQGLLNSVMRGAWQAGPWSRKLFSGDQDCRQPVGLGTVAGTGLPGATWDRHPSLSQQGPDPGPAQTTDLVYRMFHLFFFLLHEQCLCSFVFYLLHMICRERERERCQSTTLLRAVQGIEPEASAMQVLHSPRGAVSLTTERVPVQLCCPPRAQRHPRGPCSVSET